MSGSLVRDLGGKYACSLQMLKSVTCGRDHAQGIAGIFSFEALFAAFTQTGAL